MPYGYTYASYQAAVVTQIPSLTSDPNFTTMLPDSIDYAELSIQRDLDFLAMHGTIQIGNTTPGTAAYPVPSSVVVLESLFYGPSGVPVSPLGSTPITPASQDYIRTVYGDATRGPPKYFAVVGAASGSTWTPGMQVIIGPAPDIPYSLSGYGTERQAPLSATNTTTFISMNLPDLFWAAAMIFWSGYRQNFGAMTDSPQMPMSWSSEYKRLLQGAQVEEARKRFMSAGATSLAPAPLAQQRA